MNTTLKRHVANFWQGAVKYWHAYVHACGEVLITFSPILVLFLVFGVLGKMGDITNRADVSFVMAVLFADGAWRALKPSKIKDSERAAILAVGVVGAMMCTASATLLLLVELSVFPRLQVFPVTSHLASVNFWLFIGAVMYSMVVRVETF